MKRGSTLFLRAVILLLAVGVLALCIFALPSIYSGGVEEYPMAARSFLVIITVLYATTIPFFIAAWQAFKLLNYIDHKKAFSDLSVKALKNIKYCAIVIMVLYLLNVPYLLPIAQADDAPGLVLFGLISACAPIVVAVFAAILERLLKDAITIKAENDLTI